MLLAAAACVWVAGGPGRPGDPVRLRLQVTPSDVPVSSLSADLVHAGVTTNLPLSDDGRGADATAGDGTYTAAWDPAGPAALLPLELWLRSTPAGVRERIYAGVEPLTAGENVLSWTVAGGPAPLVRPQAHPGGRRDVAAAEARWMLWNIGFAILALGGVLSLARRPARDAGAPDASRVQPRRRAALKDALFWLGMAVLWTWPAALGGPDAWIGRHFDTPSTIWVIDAAPRLLRNLFDPRSGWPVGADYRTLDSLLLLPIGAALHGIHPAQVHAWIQILGVALSGWAAQAFARGAGVRPPWDLLAGMGFACSGAMASVLLEGQVYHALNPWLPLFGWAFWRTTSPEARLRDGLASAAAFGLCLATSGYVGVSAAVLGAGLLAGALTKGARIPRGPVVITLVAAAAMVLLYAHFFTGDAPLRRDTSLTAMRLASAHLASLAGPTPDVDRAGQSMAAAISPVGLAWLVAALAWRRGMKRGRTLFWTAAAGLLIAMGPVWGIGATGAALPSPLRLALNTPFDVVLRFPLRSMGVWNLCAGILAFGVADRIAGGRARVAGAVALLVVLHAFLVVRLPQRQTAIHAGVPSACRGAGGPVLDVFPAPRGIREEMWFKARACACQIAHRRPIADNCLSTEPGRQPRMRLGAWLERKVREGDVRDAARELAGMGFSAVALHADFFPPEDRAVLEGALMEIGTRRTTSTDGGERVVVQELPRADPAPSPASRILAFETAVGSVPDAGVDRARVTGQELAMADEQSRVVALAGWGLYAAIALGWVRAAGRRRASGANLEVDGGAG